MTHRHVVRNTLLLALVAMAGIVGMLLTDGWGDAACFVLAALPLLLGIRARWVVRHQRQPARR